MTCEIIVITCDKLRNNHLKIYHASMGSLFFFFARQEQLLEKAPAPCEDLDS